MKFRVCFLLALFSLTLPGSDGKNNCTSFVNGSESEENSTCTPGQTDEYEFDWYLWIPEICIVLTFAIYACVDELRECLAGKIMLASVGTLLSKKLLEILRSLFIDKIAGGPFCTAAGYMQQFLEQTNFTWLNVMGIDAHNKIKDDKDDNNKKTNDSQKIKKYGLYAFGGPLAIVALTVLIGYCPWVPLFIPKLKISKTCNLEKTLSKALYTDASIFGTIFSNIWMLVKSSLTLKRRKDANVNEEAEGVSPGSQLSTLTQFCMFIKLFAILGINWALQMMVTFVSFLQRFSTLMFYVDSFLGVMIFLVFVCNKQVLFLVNKKLCPNHMIFKEKYTNNKDKCRSKCDSVTTCCFLLKKKSQKTRSDGNDPNQSDNLTAEEHQ